MSDERLCVTCPVLRPHGQPRYVDHPMCCAGCRSHLADLLAEIPGLYALIPGMSDVEPDLAGLKQWPDGTMHPHNDPIGGSLTSGPVRGANTGPQVRGKPASSLPGNPDLWDLTAPARPGSIGIRERDMWEGSGADPDQVGYLSVATELDFWVRDWRDTLFPDHSLPGVTVVELAGWLRVRLPQACDKSLPIDEFAATVKSLASTLRSKVDPRPHGASAGNCPAKLRDDTRCNARLTVDAYMTAEPIYCPRCGSSWERREGGWTHLRAQQDEWITEGEVHEAA